MCKRILGIFFTLVSTKMAHRKKLVHPNIYVLYIVHLYILNKYAYCILNSIA